jgi:hypothetical protein
MALTPPLILLSSEPAAQLESGFVSYGRDWSCNYGSLDSQTAQPCRALRVNERGRIFHAQHRALKQSHRDSLDLAAVRRDLALDLTQQTLQALRVRVEQRQRLREVGAVLAVSRAPRACPGRFLRTQRLDFSGRFCVENRLPILPVENPDRTARYFTHETTQRRCARRPRCSRMR